MTVDFCLFPLFVSSRSHIQHCKRYSLFIIRIKQLPVADDDIEELLKHAEENVIQTSTLLHTQDKDQFEDDAEEENPKEPEDTPS